MSSTLWGYRYYTLAGIAPVHYAAIALHAEMKLDYFKSEWSERPNWVEEAKKETIALWETEYKNPARQEMPTSLDRDDEPQWRRNKRARLAAEVSDQFERFQMQREHAGTIGGLDYWLKIRESGDVAGLSDLTNMGIAIHSIPGMSSEPERVFSR